MMIIPLFAIVFCHGAILIVSATNTTYEEPDMISGLINQSKERKPLHLLALVSYSGSWATGDSTKYVYELALKHINQNPDILPGYELKVIWEDDQVRK